MEARSRSGFGLENLPRVSPGQESRDRRCFGCELRTRTILTRERGTDLGMRRLRKRVHGLLRCALVILGWLAVTDLSAKSRWVTGSVEEFTVYANTSKWVASEVVADLRQLKALFRRVYPKLVLRNLPPLRVFALKNEATMRRFSRLVDGKPVQSAGSFIQDYEGALILINTDADREFVRKVIFHEYVHFLLSGIHLPTWLNEGLAELYSTVEISKVEATIGKADGYRAARLQRARIIPLERFFRITRHSPEYSSEKHGRGVFYAQSWALVHFLSLGLTNLPQGAFSKLVGSVLTEPIVSEETFTETTGLSFDEVERRLKKYVRGGQHQYLRLRTPALPKDETLELTPVSEGESDLIVGMLLLATREPEEAYAPLEYASRKLPDSPKAAAYRGYYLYRQRLYPAAVEAFVEAIERGSESASTYLFHAAAILQRDNPDRLMLAGIFDREATVTLLRSLFKARELGERRAILYRNIGQVWLNSEVTAREGHIGAVAEGLRLHPDDELLGYYVSRLLFNIEKYDEARTVVRTFLEKEIPNQARQHFEELEERIDKAEEMGSG